MSETTVSALVCTYMGDNPDELQRSIASLLSQTRELDELVIIEDGPLSKGLTETLNQLESEASIPFVRESLPENIGQGGARRKGVKIASGDLIAIHDADDLAVPERIEKSLAVMNETGADLVGGFIEEFVADPNNPHAVRKVPCEPDEIWQYAKSRSPVNQTTVLACRDAILEAGNYRRVDRMEDYELWIRMLVSGHHLRNIPEVLAKVRAGKAMFDRRGGIEYAKEEIRMQRYMRQLGFISRRRALVNALTRGGVRLLPNAVRGAVYRICLRER